MGNAIIIIIVLVLMLLAFIAGFVVCWLFKKVVQGEIKEALDLVDKKLDDLKGK